MSLTRVLVRSGQLAGLAALLGVVGALVWANVTELPSYVVQADGHATIAESDVAKLFSGNFWFVVIGAFAGLAVGVASWIRLRSLGWMVAVITAALSVLAAIVCWKVGELIGPGPFAARLAAAGAGDQVRIALTLTTPSALAAWVFAATAVPLFAASLGPDPEFRARVARRRHAPAEDAALAGVSDG
ncbi:MAG: hypothetical protein QM708_16490 [Propioniciclava sp.]|uniref:hypothetical protein n=1 Tax=Propioniciclava sp. TaxID=2038686 RepID=UPI0039E57C0B